MKPSNKQVVILMGAPGAGKGTQAELLSEKLNLYYFETSKILEQTFWHAKDDEFLEVEGTKYFLANEKKLWKEGILCSPPFVTELMKKKFETLASEDKNLLLAGSPRTLYEGQLEIPLLEKLYGKGNIHIVLIELTEDQTMFRNSHRRLCELMRHPVLYNEETKNLSTCPLDGSRLEKREGLDDPNTIKVRLKQYEERTVPLTAFFESEGLNVHRVNGNQSVAQVFADISKTLGLNGNN